MLSLDDLGWSPRLDAAFAEHRSAGLSPARVSLEHTHIYRVLTPDGELLARVSGRLRHDAVEPRRFSRRRRLGRARTAAAGAATRASARCCRDPAASRAARPAIPPRSRCVAANIDIVFLVSGLDHDFNPRRIERYLRDRLGQRRRAGHRPEQGGPRRRSARRRRAGRRSRAAGVPVARRVRPSARVDGCAARASRRGRTAALLGSSGVGKSSIANGSSATTCCARARSARATAADGTRARPAADAAAGRRHPHRHARHARAAAVGHRRGAGRRVRRHRGARRVAAAFATAAIRREPGCAVADGVAADGSTPAASRASQAARRAGVPGAQQDVSARSSNRSGAARC